MRGSFRVSACILCMLLLSTASAFAGGGLEIFQLPDAPEGHAVYSFEDGMIDLSVEGDNLVFSIEAPTTGWVAVGFDPENRMEGANYILGYVRDGEVFVEDHYGNGPISHLNDERLGGTNDLISFSGSERDGSTRIEVTIPLDSGDEADKPLVRGESYTMLVAYGPNGADNFTAIHRARGGAEVTIP